MNTTLNVMNNTVPVTAQLVEQRHRRHGLLRRLLPTELVRRGAAR